jgi:5-methyltetrahydropteroyltriglutamate--homocysteine methyltransferase
VRSQDKPPFRADHVGSLLRPERLLEARRKARAGELSDEALRSVQDECIVEVLARQRSLGLPVATDGEFRRDWWHIDFLDALDGVDAVAGDAMVKFQGSEQPLTLKVNGRIRRSNPIFVEHFKFLKAHSRAVPKITIPAPAMLYHRTGRAAISEAAYPDLEEMWSDAAQAYREEIADLGAAGCEYLQIDDVSFAYFCDPGYHETFRKRGEDPDRLLRTYAQAINRALEGRPKGMTVALHTCRGNFMSTWAAQGGYEPVAETLFNDVGVDAYFLEFDSERAGGFEPLRFLPKGKKAVLGLVTTKVPALESRDSLLRRIDEATKYADIENLCLSPQCGFSSTHHGNRISPDDQWRKLELVLDVASRVWG